MFTFYVVPPLCLCFVLSLVLLLKTYYICDGICCWVPASFPTTLLGQINIYNVQTLIHCVCFGTTFVTWWLLNPTHQRHVGAARFECLSSPSTKWSSQTFDRLTCRFSTSEWRIRCRKSSVTYLSKTCFIYQIHHGTFIII